MKIFVTGGAGFIGSNFIHYMLQVFPECQIMNYDCLTYAANLNNLSDLPDPTRYTFAYGNICNLHALNYYIKQFEPTHIVHFAAESHVDRSLNSSQEFIETNVLGTNNMLKVTRTLNNVKMIHISTDEVYGSLLEGEANERYPFKANSPYSASKAGGDLLCRAYYKSHDTPVVIVRGSNCYGPRQHPEKLIPKSCIAILTGNKVPLYGDGTNQREWIFTTDFCRGVLQAMLKGEPGQAYNLGGGSVNRIDNITLLNKIISLIDDPNITFESAVEFVKDRPGHDQRYALNSDKLATLGWKPEITLEGGLTITLDYYKRY